MACRPGHVIAQAVVGAFNLAWVVNAADVVHVVESFGVGLK